VLRELEKVGGADITRFFLRTPVMLFNCAIVFLVARLGIAAFLPSNDYATIQPCKLKTK
jgi:hypothetical protein